MTHYHGSDAIFSPTDLAHLRDKPAHDAAASAFFDRKRAQARDDAVGIAANLDQQLQPILDAIREDQQ